MLSNPLLLGGGGADYQIQRSLRLRASATAYLSRTPAGAGNRKTWTWSGWVKRGTLGSAQHFLHVGTTSAAGNFGNFGFNAANQFDLEVWAGAVFTTNMVFRDPSAWAHIIIAVDTTQATAANRVKLYVNGVQVTSFATDAIATYYTLNYDTAFNQSAQHSISSRNPYSADNFFDGYLSEVNFIDGQALTPSSFGLTDPTTGVWTAKKYTGTYGTNGFYLPFTDTTSATTLCYDASGNGNNWTPNNISTTPGATYDSMLDVPLAYGTTDRGNYAVLSPIDQAANTFISSGNLYVYDSNSPFGNSTIKASIAFDIAGSAGFTWEVAVGSSVNAANAQIGLCPSQQAPTSTYSATGAVVVASGGIVYLGGVSQGTFLGWANGDVIKFWCGSGNVYYSVNGVPANSGSPVVAGLSGNYVPSAFRSSSAAVNPAWEFNFGQAPLSTGATYHSSAGGYFKYTPPTGFKSLHTGNLP